MFLMIIFDSTVFFQSLNALKEQFFRVLGQPFASKLGDLMEFGDGAPLSDHTNRISCSHADEIFFDE